MAFLLVKAHVNMEKAAFECNSALNKSDEIGVFYVKNSMRSNKIPGICVMIAADKTDLQMERD